MKYPPYSLAILLCAGCGSVSDWQDPTTLGGESVSFQLERARAFLVEGDSDAALQITDRLFAADRDDRAVHLLAAEANMAMAAEGTSLREALLHDAERHYREALGQDSKDPENLLRLSAVYWQLGEFELGRDRALDASELLEGDEREFSRALLQSAEHELRIFAEARSEELASEETELQDDTRRKAEAVLSRLERAKRGQPGGAFLKAALVYQWLGKTLDELNELERGIAAATDHFPLHDRYLEFHAQRGQQAQCASFYRKLIQERGTDISVLHALGQAESGLGNKHRADGDLEAAGRAYSSSISTFEQAMARAPTNWTENCTQWIAIQHISIAAIDLDAGNLSESKTQLKQAFKRTPKVLETDEDGFLLILDAFNSNYLTTLARLGEAVQNADWSDGVDFWEEFIELHPDQYFWLYNNAAYAAREYGTALAGDGREGDNPVQQTAAMEQWERSYEHYCSAVVLAPDDARTLNDCGLMLVFHLLRDYGRALELFDRAIQAGTVAFEELDEDTPIAVKNDVEEALGDAWENKGKTYGDTGKPYSEYEEFLKKAVEFFPYQRRDAARWIRDNGVLSTSQQGQQTRVDPRTAQFEPIAAAAAKLANEGNFDEALYVLDGASKEMANFAPYHFYQGLYALNYALQAVATGGSAGQIDGLFADARNELQKSVELDNTAVDPQVHLAAANYESGELVNASLIAANLLSSRVRARATPEQLAEIRKVRAKAGTQLYIAAKQAGGDDVDELAGARGAFRNLESSAMLDQELRRMWSTMEQWAGNSTSSLNIYVRALDVAPTDQVLLGELIDVAIATSQCARAADVLADRDDALGLWYLGRARFGAGTDAGTEPANAETFLQAAIVAFESSAAANADYGDSTLIWIASCTGALGFTALQQERFGLAEEKFLESAKLAPARVNENIHALGSVKLGLLRVVDHHYSSDDLPSAIATLQAASAVIEDDADLSNNLGLFARDHGVALEREGDTTQAKQLFELSYTAYQNSVRIEPESVRLRNDLMLMLLYHLKRDLDQVPEVLAGCIKDGERQLAEEPPTDAEALRDLQEAVGDCYENLGLYYMRFGNDKANARMNFEKSLTFYPLRQRASVALLRELDG